MRRGYLDVGAIACTKEVVDGANNDVVPCEVEDGGHREKCGMRYRPAICESIGSKEGEAEGLLRSWLQ